MTGEGTGSEDAARKESAWASLSASWEQDEQRRESEADAPDDEPSTWERSAGLRDTARSLRYTPETPAGGGVGGAVLGAVLTALWELGLQLVWRVLAEWMSLRRAGAVIAGASAGIALGALVVPRVLFPEDRVTQGPMVGALLKGEVAALLFAVLIAGFGGGMIALLAHQRRLREEEARRDEDGARSEDTEEPPPGPPGAGARRRAAAALGVLELIAVGGAWFLVSALLTATFFYADGVTAAEHLAGERPGSLWGTGHVVPFLLGALVCVVVALLAADSASKLSSPHPSRSAQAR